MISLICFLILLPLAIITAFFGAELIIGLRPLPRTALAGQRIRSAIVVPANNEEELIRRTVGDLKRLSDGPSSLIVVADNCTDRTAQRAREAGAHVLIRSDSDRRGKGYALAFARDHLRQDPPEVIVIIDADCRTDAQSFDALVEVAAVSRRACQAVYLFDPVPKGPALVQISTLAFMIKNLVRQRALQRFAGRAHLTGTGMALPWSVFDTADFGGANIVEDLALGLELAERGEPPILVESATVWSPTATTEGTLTQRKRWEGGYLATAFKAAPKAFLRSLSGGDLRGLLAALDLAIPPLALLFLLNLIAVLIAILAATAGQAMWLLLAQLAISIFAAVGILLAWLREGRRFASAGTLLRIPLYILWKLPMYAALLRRGAPKEWLRPGR